MKKLVMSLGFVFIFLLLMFMVSASFFPMNGKIVDEGCLKSKCEEYKSNFFRGICENRNRQNCLVHSQECFSGEIKNYTCPDGEQVYWCDCVDKKWHCIKSPETQCGGEIQAVYNCQILSEENRFYELQNDVSSSETCFTIEADSVTLNLNGYSVIGEGYGAGINISNCKGINIMDGKIISFSDSSGINLFNSNNNVVKNVYFENNGYGISLENSSDNVIENNSIMQSQSWGIYLLGKSWLEGQENKNNLITKNRIFQSDLGGIVGGDSDNIGNIITENSIENNGAGIKLYSNNEVDNVSNNIIKNNSILNNVGFGIMIEGDNNLIIDNDIRSATHEAEIEIREGNFNIIKNNDVSGNGKGIYLRSGSLNNITDNRIYENDEEGIMLSGSNFDIISGNKIYNNGIVYGHGIEIQKGLEEPFNLIYDNFFNNSENVRTSFEPPFNYWNTTLSSETNIIEGPYLGGNYWAEPDGTGFSETCEDSDSDGICDTIFVLDEDNIDYLPLTYVEKSFVERIKSFFKR